MSPQTYCNSTMRSTTKTHSLSLLSGSETPYRMKYLMKDIISGETCWKTPNSPWTAKKSMGNHPLSWGRQSLPSRGRYCPCWPNRYITNQLLSNGIIVEHRRPPGEHHKAIVPSNNQPPTELSLSAWTNSQLASACWNQGKLLVWMIY